MYFVYVIKSLKLGTYYKGQTQDIDRRLKEHESGCVAATRHLLPIKLIHVETIETRYEARILEKYFKSGRGREIIKEIDLGRW